MALRFSNCLLTLRSLSIAVLFLGIVAPTHGAVDLIGDISTGVIADPWIITQQTTIGFSEATILDVYDGGVVDSNTFLIIGSENSNSTQYVQVNVRDAGSSLSARDLIIGNFGAVPRMHVENGGAVVVDNDFEMRSKSTLIVTDPGSQLTIGDYFSMASSTEIIIANGGTVESGVNQSSGIITTVISYATIKGSGSTWTNHNALQVSNLRVEDGGQLISTNDSSFAFTISGDANLDGGTIIAEEITRSGAGRLNFHSGTLILNQAGLTVGGAGLLGSDVHVDSSSTIDVSGEVVVDSTAKLFVEGALVSSALTNNGSLILEGATLEQPVTSPAGSTIDVIGDITFNGLVSGAGGIFGSGTATFNGGYSPGDSPAVVPIETDLALGALNSLDIELAGTASGEFDQLNIAGDVTLAGALDVSLIDGFALDPQQEFTILDIEGELTGQFDGLAEGARVGGSNGVDLFITYTAGNSNDVALFTTAIPEPTSMTLLASALFALLLGRKHRSPPCFKSCLGAMIITFLSVLPSSAAIQTVGSVAPEFQAGLFVDPILNNVIPWNPSGLQVGHLGPERGLLVISDTSRNGYNHDTVNVDSSILVGSSVHGTLVVTGSDAQLTGNLFKIGNGAPGLFLVSDGASVVTGEDEGESRIGGDPVVGTGQAVISDSGSNWTHYDLKVTALGELEVKDGASVDTTNFANNTGPVTVTGAGSVWNVGGMALSTESASVIVADGGQVNVMGEFYLPFLGGEPILYENQGVRLLTAGSLTIRGGTFSTNYFTNFDPGILNFEYGTLNLSDSGLVIGAAGLMGDAVNIDSDSAINLSDDVTVEAGASLTVAGTLSSASLNNNGNLTLIDTTLDQPVTSPAGSVMNVIGDVTFNGPVSGAGDIFGSGTPLFNGGYSPGDSPAVVEIEHDIIFGAANTLTIELAGLLEGEYDALQIGGDATLAGELDVELIGGFELDPHQEFLILNVAGERTGQFIDLEEGDNVGMFGEFGGVGNFGDTPLFISYEGGDGNDVVLYTTPTLEGDFDADGDVDGSDFLAWQRTDGTPAGLSGWQMNYGTLSSAAAAATSVPEPSSFLLLLTSCLFAAHRSRR
ncbi:hypothetical protein [Adhaeretor mobilis]|uniref:PEP-CTERM protein-sorting domain-containing protein n=1 Tax=Adhaeretor mobilis TaxID=1930276 RepID=A0A517N0M8_9BACT|nr:hypothetical protein [Adhaeretor mobilis]QDT00692.1 hypothetical protein HG15A2_40320 [Adhaeretor mobilis]